METSPVELCFADEWHEKTDLSELNFEDSSSDYAELGLTIKSDNLNHSNRGDDSGLLSEFENFDLSDIIDKKSVESLPSISDESRLPNADSRSESELLDAVNEKSFVQYLNNY